MAEVAVLALSLLQMITPQLIEKLKLQLELKEDIKIMESWHTFLQAFAEDNYGRQDSKTLLDILRKVAKTTFAIEDVVDEFNLLSLHDSVPENIIDYGRRIRLPEKIATINKDIETIKAQKAFASDSINPPSSSTSTPTGHPLPQKDDMVGYENLGEKFITSLVRGDKRLVTLAVDGPPGSGKTTFVDNICSDPKVKKKFDVHGFVSNVGKTSWNVLVQKLCESMNVPEHGSSIPQSRLRKFLYGKRYLIVVDDIWRAEDWKNLKESLPDSSKRSRVIVTTRSSEVSAICDHVTTLQGLEGSEGLKLFIRRAFPKKKCPPELTDVSMNIVSRCGGLPLAIVAIADTLAQKQNQWERFAGNLGSEIWSNPDLGKINDSVLCSYMNLSSRLKCCLLYMSVFPEDRPVGRGRLVRLWVAERFAVATDCQTAEEVAEDYLNQLVRSNLIVESNSDSRTNFCLSYIILNFVVRKSKDENFASVYSERQAVEEQRRRLSFHDHLPEDGGFDTVRSMFIFRSRDERDPLDSDFERNMRKLKLIKVVDVQGANLTKFGKEITRRLALLRYLSFRDTKIERIPTSIHKLSHLETLDLKRTHVTKLPGEISNLQNLRHVLASNVSNHDSEEGVELAEGIISKLTELQSLSLIKVSPNGGVLKDLKALTKLRKLGLTGLRTEHGEDLCAALELMKSLETLDITAAEGDRIELEETMKNPPKSLQRLYLEGGLSKIPGWFSELNRAVRIDLKFSALNFSPLEALKGLENLRELRLVGCFDGEELRFEEGFEKVEVIVMEDLANLRRLKVRSGAAPELKRIRVRKCPLLKKPFRVGRLVEDDKDKEEDINGGDFDINKWINRARSFVPDRISDKIDTKLRKISGRR